jgi:hypothetical protein
MREELVEGKMASEGMGKGAIVEGAGADCCSGGLVARVNQGWGDPQSLQAVPSIYLVYYLV